jgi:hypothetical protein
MEHNDAVRLEATEKYLMGELSKMERDEYEEHYFDCSICSEELKATLAFMETVKQVGQEQALAAASAPAAAPAISPEARPAGSGFLGWLRPAFAVPVFAALLLFVGYQNAVTIPRLRQSETLAASATTYKPFSLPAFGTRGEGAPFTVSVQPGEAFALDVDMPGNSADGYFCRFQDQAGRVVLSHAVSPEEAKSTVHFLFQAGAVQAGEYTLQVFPGQAPAGDAASAVAHQSFVVEFSR